MAFRMWVKIMSQHSLYCSAKAQRLKNTCMNNKGFFLQLKPLTTRSVNSTHVITCTLHALSTNTIHILRGCTCSYYNPVDPYG